LEDGQPNRLDPPLGLMCNLFLVGEHSIKRLAPCIFIREF